jgi:hypothetical protein
MNDRTPNHAFDADLAINECMDLEVGGRPDELRELIRKSVAQDPDFENKLLKARAVVGQLRGMPQTPNMAPEILAEVDYLRPFLSPRKRRQVSATRVAVAAAAVITLSFMAVMQRMYPKETSLTQQPTPVDGVVKASGADAADSLNSIVSAVGEMRTSVAKPAPVGRPHRWNGPIWSGPDSLVMGDVSRYDSGTNWSKELTLSLSHPGLLLGAQPMDTELQLAQTGWIEAPAKLTLVTGTGLLEQRSTNSLVPGVDPGASLLNLEGDGLLGSSWAHKTELERLLKGTEVDRSKNPASK